MKIKQNRNKILKVFSIIALYILAIVGIVFGSINIGENNTKKGFYGETYAMSFSVDVSSATTSSEKTKLLQNDAEKFSNWLLYKNISNSGVQYEMKNDQGYIWVELTNVNQITYTNGDKGNPSPEWTSLNTINSSRVDIYQYNPNGTDTTNDLSTNAEDYKNTTNKYTKVLSSSEFKYDTATKDTRTENNSYGVEVDLNKVVSVQKFYDEKTAENTTSNGINWLVVQNIDVLLAKLNFAKYVVYQHNNYRNQPIEFQNKINFLYETMDSNLQTWANQVYTDSKGQSDPVSEKNFLHYYELSKAQSSDSDTSTASIRLTSSEANANATFATIVDDYVLGTITNSNYNNWFPDATVVGSTSSSDDTTTETASVQSRASNKVDVNTISFQPTTANESYQNDYIYQFKNTVLSNILFPEIFNGRVLDSQQDFYQNIGSTWIQQPYLQDSITTLSSYEATFLASGIVLLIVAIIVSILYRIPGLFGAFSIISSFGLSASLFVLLGINFSIPAVLGLFIATMVSVFSISLFMERTRNLFKRKNSVFDSLQTSIRKLMMTILDLNVTVIIFGLCLFFFGKGEVLDFGLVLILAPSITLFTTFAFFLYPVYSVSNFTGLWKYSKHIWSKDSWNEPRESNYKIRFKPNQWWIGWAIALVIAILSIVLIFTIGVPNSASFNSGSTIYVLFDNTKVSQDQIANALPGTWSNITSGLSSGGRYDNNFYVLSAISTTVYDYNAINQALSKLTGIQDIFVSNSLSTFNVGIATSGLYGLLAAFGFLSIYYILRLNVFSIIPIFIVNVFGLAMAISICYLTQMYVDLFFVYAMIYASIMSTLATCGYISTSKTNFNKKKYFDKHQIQMFIQNNMVGMLNTIFIVLFVNTMIMVVLAIFVSPTTVWLFICVMFGTIASVWFSYFGIPHLYYYSLLLRQNYINNVINSIDKKINNEHDEVDEQLIMSINKFE